MLNFSSISLANTKVKYAAFAAAYLVAIFLYWPSFSGHPIWDDYTYWFFDPVMNPEFSYWKIMTDFGWPVSVNFQKLLVNIFHTEWWVYHVISFATHCLNSWLVYRLLRLLRLGVTAGFLGFFFFLIQPSSVITVAWMIQLKTLMCFTFALGSIIFFIRARGKKDLFISLFLFLLAVLSKSSSLPLPMVLLFFLGKSWKTKRALVLIPFFLISAYGAYRISNSKITMEGIESASKVATELVVEDTAPVEVPKPVEAPKKPEMGPRIFKPVPDEPLNVPKMTEPPTEVQVLSPETDEKVRVPQTKFDIAVAHTRLFIKTLYYYFWQTVIPLDNAPVKGLNPFPPGLQDYIHLFFLITLSFIAWKMQLLGPFIAGHIFLLPYLGIIPAPYMNITWVSDQHIYLALPCFIILFFSLLEKLKSKWAMLPVAILLVLFMVKTREASHFYKNSFSFYEQSIRSNINNIPVVYNLSIMLISIDKKQEAADLLETMIIVAEKEKHMKENKYYPYLIHLYSQLVPERFQ